MAGYIGSKSSVTLVDGYTETEADAEFVTKTGDTMTGDLSFGDNDKAKFGAGSDLQIYHDGSNSYIKDAGSGQLRLVTDGSEIAMLTQGGLEYGVRIIQDGAVEIRHDDSTKLATTSTGIDVTGEINTTGNVVVGGNIGAQKYKLNDGSTFAGGMFVEKDVTGSGSSNDITIFADGITDGGNIHFMSGGTADVRLSVDSSGNVLTGKTTTSTSVEGISTSQAARTNIASGGEPFYFYYFYSGAQVGSISHNASSTSFNTSSDYRLKENVVDLTGASARVNQLNPSRFNFIADETNTLVDGFLAHEVATVVPEAINGTHNEVEVWKDGEELPDGVSVGDNKTDDDGNTIPVYQGIDQSKLVPLLTAALQEALAEITSLKTRVEALEA